jgi:hypothetical protein
VTAGEPDWQRLPTPRRLTTAERNLVLALLRPTGSARLRAQARAASVVGTCACGCASLQIQTSAPPLPSADVAAMSTTGRFDYVGVSAEGTNPTGRTVQVALHVLEGVIVELEVFAGEGVSAAAPAATDLRGITLI